MGDHQESYYIEGPSYQLVSELDWRTIEGQLIDETGHNGNTLDQVGLYLTRLEDTMHRISKQLVGVVDSVTKIEKHILPQKSHYQTKREYLEAKADAAVYKDKYTRKRK